MIALIVAVALLILRELLASFLYTIDYHFLSHLSEPLILWCFKDALLIVLFAFTVEALIRLGKLFYLPFIILASCYVICCRSL